MLGGVKRVAARATLTLFPARMRSEPVSHGGLFCLNPQAKAAPLLLMLKWSSDHSR